MVSCSSFTTHCNSSLHVAGWPIYWIGQCFRQPVFSLPKCPINLSLSSLVLLCFLCCCCMFAADILWHCLVNNILFLVGLLCSVVTPNSLPFLVSLSPPVREYVLPHSQRCRATPLKVLILQWLQFCSGEKGQDLQMKQRYIHLADHLW